MYCNREVKFQDKLKDRQAFSHQRNFDFITIISTRALYSTFSKGLQLMP